MNLKELNFGFFMTRGMSLAKWDKINTLEREIKPYQNLANFFNEVYIFTYGGSEDKEYLKLFPENIHLLTRPKFIPSTIYSFLLPFIHYKKLRNINILKTNQMDGSWVAVISKKIYNSKLVIRCGYEWLQTIENKKMSFLKRTIAYCVEKFAYHNADKIILTSDYSKKFVEKKFKIGSSKIQVIPNYIDVNLFKPLNLEKEKNRIIFVGRLEKEKNLENLFYGLEGLSVKLMVVGSGSLRGRLEEIKKEKKLDVVFMGNLSQPVLVEELNKSEIFILPSFYEGSPKVLLEAMSCGVACIGTNVEGINSIIVDGVDGILSELDSKSLNKAILKLIENKELCDKIGISARGKIEMNNSFEVFIDRELSLYRTI